MTEPAECDETGCACHGWPVTVWVVGPATQDDADAMVERLVATPPPGITASVVRG